uniref:enoyl-CoA delta isomerase 1, mitochondrial isoform X2 n=1 Tax=Callithrix jacchus TaxID=9483 RepID=UPI0004F00BA1|nr:enoyl-CoA delta isomerase 1, mitochondrial isoform X2 [Callithrix jacchus]
MALAAALRVPARMLLRAGARLPGAALGLTERGDGARRFGSQRVLVEPDAGAGVAVMRLNNPPVNTLSLEFLTELVISLEKLENDKSFRGVILTSKQRTGLPVLHGTSSRRLCENGRAALQAHAAPGFFTRPKDVEGIHLSLPLLLTHIRWLSTSFLHTVWGKHPPSSASVSQGELGPAAGTSPLTALGGGGTFVVCSGGCDHAGAPAWILHPSPSLRPWPAALTGYPGSCAGTHFSSRGRVPYTCAHRSPFLCSC